MRWRNRRDTQDFRASEPVPVKRDPSVPDRERIDSDVRAFMRPVSTPWIVFDRDSRLDSELAFATKAAMRAGVAFMSNPDLSPPPPAPVLAAQLTPAPQTAAARLADINAMFPGSVPQQKVNDEPSSLIVAADVVPEAPKPSLSEIVPMKRSRLGLIGATLGAVGVCSIAAYVIASLQAAPAPAPAAAAEPPKVEAVAAVAPPPAPEPAPVVEAPAPPPAPEPAAAPAEVVGENATDPKKRWGTLTIKSKKQVWFDGKRMLGTGNRSFMVYCGMHTVAVAEKTAQKDMEVPCNGELTIDNK
jgi:hypothetical protein